MRPYTTILNMERPWIIFKTIDEQVTDTTSNSNSTRNFKETQQVTQVTLLFHGRSNTLLKWLFLCYLLYFLEIRITVVCPYVLPVALPVVLLVDILLWKLYIIFKIKCVTGFEIYLSIHLQGSVNENVSSNIVTHNWVLP